MTIGMWGRLTNDPDHPMPFFYLRTPPGTAWPPVPFPEVAQVWAAYLELDRTQWLAPTEIESLQLEQLRSLLLHCFHNVPYYRHVLASAGISSRPIDGLEEFRRIPFLTRELYQTHFDSIQAKTLPSGMTSVWSGFTSGTNGVPIKVCKTNRDGLWWNAFFLRDLEWCQLDPRKKLAAIRLLAMNREQLPQALNGRSLPYWGKLCQALFETGPAHAMDIRQDPRKQIEWLHRIRPNYILSLPSNLELLAGMVQERSERLPELEAIQAIGEPLAPATQQRIEAGFGVPVKNLYSTTECGYIASPCPDGHGLHVHSENVFVEVLDANDQSCKPGQTGRLVFTSLHNFITPFVRYEIMDDVTLADGPCPCGRGLPLWTNVDGRRHPMLHLPDGRRKSSMGITLGIRKVGGVHQFQIIQRSPEHVILRVVPDRTWQAENPDLMRQVVHAEFESPIQVDVEQKEFLERPAGGKLKIVVVEMDAEPMRT